MFEVRKVGRQKVERTDLVVWVSEQVEPESHRNETSNLTSKMLSILLAVKAPYTCMVVDDQKSAFSFCVRLKDFIYVDASN